MHLSQMQNSTTSNITMSHTKQHREETFPFDGGLGVAAGVGGIIPAHAGLTLSVWIVNRAVRDHPRACGAHLFRSMYGFILPGSSPRMRGSRRVIRAEYFDEGIIPAHAGLTDTAGRLCRPKWDRPRACGAHIEYDVPKNMVSGSSPRMRGSHLRDCGIGRRLGIIPAHAGLTTLLAGICGPSGDHPRACGAHRATRYVMSINRGSSPLMRGSRFRLEAADGEEGIIPAHAGSRAVPAGRHEPGGIIPAHAGLTKVSSHSNILSGDHPRACGAHAWQDQLNAIKQGSSPRMRGSRTGRDCF